MDTKSTLIAASGTGEIIKIRYHGGSHPGSLRDIAPISVNGLKVRARCYVSNAIKMFFIDKVEIVELSAKCEHWENASDPGAKFENLNQLLGEQIKTFSELGWHIESTLDGDAHSIRLHRRKKNGIPLKGFDVSVSYEKYAYDMVVDLETDADELEVTRQISGERKRPWTVSAKNETTKSFGSLDKAAILFIEWAEKHAPASK